MTGANRMTQNHRISPLETRNSISVFYHVSIVKYTHRPGAINVIGITLYRNTNLDLLTIISTVCV